MDNEISRPLSGRDIVRLVGNRAKVMRYSKLQEYNNIEDVFGGGDAVIVLYESKRNFGHWTLILNRPENYEHFDSYGLKPDQELKFVPKPFKQQYYNDIPHLTLLLYKSEKPTHYSQYKLQSEKQNVNTCGRWCVVRALLKRLSEDQFHELFTGKGVNPDAVVTMVTESL